MKFIPEYLVSNNGLSTPDMIDSVCYFPGPDHVMSRDSDGDVVSCYGDSIWDFSMYIGKGSRYNIDEFIDELHSIYPCSSYRGDFKIILFRIIYNSKSKAINTVSQLYNILKRHFRVAAQNKITFLESINRKDILDVIVSDEGNTKRGIGRRISDLGILFSTLNYISINVKGFDIFPSEDVFEYLKLLSIEYPNKSSQTPVIPTRILSRRIKTCFHYIDVFLEYREIFEFLYGFNKSSFRSAIDRGVSEKYARDIASVEFKKEISKDKYCKFLDYFEVYDYISLRGVIGRVRLAIVEMIHAFSGMRIGECESIAMDGYRIKNIGGHNTAFIRSYTTKMAMENGYFSDWVTSPEVEIAFEAAKVLNYSLLIHDYGLSMDEIDESLTPLFLSSCYRSINRSKSALYKYPTSKISLNGWSDHTLNRDPEIIVRKDDINEIISIDPTIDIEAFIGVIEEGKPFSFQTHMYRRSLAVYTARSGLVSLPSLKRQLKHIRLQNSAYYAKGSTFARDFILVKSSRDAVDKAIISQRGFIKEFQDEIIQGQVDLLHDKVVNSNEVLFGGMGSRLQKQKQSGTLPTVLINRDKTAKKVKQGRLKYTETPLGGCMATEQCDRVAFSAITTCVGCDSSVFNDRTVSLLEKAVDDYERRIPKFGRSTPYGKQLCTDVENIKTVLRSRNKLINLVNSEEIPDG